MELSPDALFLVTSYLELADLAALASTSNQILREIPSVSWFRAFMKSLPHKPSLCASQHAIKRHPCLILPPQFVEFARRGEMLRVCHGETKLSRNDLALINEVIDSQLHRIQILLIDGSRIDQNMGSWLEKNMPRLPNLAVLDFHHSLLLGKSLVGFFQSPGFSRIQALCLRACGLDDAKLQSLCAAMSACARSSGGLSLISLDLKGNQICHSEPLIKLLPLAPNFRYLDLGHNKLSGIDFPSLAMHIENLDLSENCLTDEDGRAIATFFTSRSPRPRITSLALEGNRLTNVSARALLIALSPRGSSTLNAFSLVSPIRMGSGKSAENRVSKRWIRAIDALLE